MSYTKGQILSESSYYTVVRQDGKNVVLTGDDGKEVTISTGYLDMYTKSADIYEVEERKTMTELSEIFINNARVAMTVAFFKKDTEKGKKVFEKEKADLIEKIQSASLKTAATMLDDLIENPLTRIIKGELRVMKDRHEGHIDTLGRIQFTDMQAEHDKSKDYDTRKCEVDPRTIQYLIVGGVKYILKK